MHIHQVVGNREHICFLVSSPMPVCFRTSMFVYKLLITYRDVCACSNHDVISVLNLRLLRYHDRVQLGHNEFVFIAESHANQPSTV